jgi:hypothetical protein
MLYCIGRNSGFEHSNFFTVNESTRDIGDFLIEIHPRSAQSRTDAHEDYYVRHMVQTPFEDTQAEWQAIQRELDAPHVFLKAEYSYIQVGDYENPIL